MKTSKEIKLILIWIAEKARRPHYERAVAKPEFKVGDFITYNHGIADDRIYKIVEDHVVHGFVVASSGDREFWTMFVGEFVKATPAEIKAGHRLNPSNTGELETLEMIDVSPNTAVINEN